MIEERLSKREIRSKVWNYRGKYGKDKVSLYSEKGFKESGYRGSNQFSYYSEKAFIETPKGTELIYIHQEDTVGDVQFENQYGRESTKGFEELHKELIELAKYFNNLKYTILKYEEDEDIEVVGKQGEENKNISLKSWIE